jgi:hypothetical protein
MTSPTPATTPAKPARPPKPKTHKVRKVNADDNAASGPVVFESSSLGATKNYIKQHHPRGREVYLEDADGNKSHYSADLDAQGDEPWTDFSEDEDA